MRLPVLIALILIATAPSGCARFPEVYAATSQEAQQASRPVLTDVDNVLVPASSVMLDESTQAAIEARAAELEARAEAAMAAGIPPGEVAELLARAAALRDEAARVAQGG